MNPLTNTRNITKLSQRELNQNDGKTSWHDDYRDSAWIFIGGLPFDLSEGDVIAIFSQYGEIVNINLVRDKGTGKSKGFGFICYEDQKSTILAVDNLNAIKILGRTVRVDHVKDYKPPKESEKLDDITRQLYKEGCAPKELTIQRKIEDSDEELLPIPGRIKKEPTKRETIKVKVKKEKIEKSRKSKKSSKDKKKKSKSKKTSSSKKKSGKRKRKSESSSDSETDSSSTSDSDSSSSNSESSDSSTDYKKSKKQRRR